MISMWLRQPPPQWKVESGLCQLARIWHTEANFYSPFACFCGPEMRLASMETVPRLSNPWGLTPWTEYALFAQYLADLGVCLVVYARKYMGIGHCSPVEPAGSSPCQAKRSSNPWGWQVEQGRARLSCSWAHCYRFPSFLGGDLPPWHAS